MEDMDCNRQANSPEGEPLSSHRRGHWFEPITTHHSNSPPVSNHLPSEDLPLRKLLEALL